MAAETAEGSTPPVAAEDVELADVGLLVQYLRRVVPVLLEDDVVQAPLETALCDKANLDVLRKFIADTQVKTLLVQRSSSKDEELVGEGGGDVEEDNVSYIISSEVHFTNPKINSLVFIKKYSVIEADKKVPSQLRVMNLSDDSPYETLHAYVSSAMAPYFKSYVKETGRAERDGDKMAPMVEKKIAQLEMGLLHLQQNIDIPEITLTVHPVEAATIKRCAEEGRRTTAIDFGDRTEDSSFLNRWTREIQKVYQKAVEDANRVQAGRAEQISVEGQEARATSIKEKFEAGVVTQETEAEKIERLQREKQEDLSVFNETGIAHEAKNIFKQLDAEVARQSGAPAATSLARSPSNRWSVPRPPANAVSPGDVVRSSDPVRDVEVETTEVSERFKFFENFKEQAKERKRFEMTPPRDTGKEPSPEFQVQRDPNVVRAADPVEEVVVTDTARRMRERFRELEVNASREEPPQGPKPLKRITPPREYTREDTHEASPEIQRDPDVVQCSYRVEDNVVVEADRAKSMRARFENWDAERVARENRRNEENGEENECLPMADTAKNLRAKFEAIRDESERRETERPKPKVNRFVEFPGTPNSEACAICNKKLYPMERMEVSGLRMHKNCFRCSHCSCHLRLESYTISGGKLFCGPHFKQFFIAKGNYDEGFGREKWSRSASPASRESNEEYTNGDRDHMGILDQPVIA